MRTPKIYLDTSVISHLKQDDVPDKMNDTLKLWEDIKNGHYDVYISESVLAEIYDCRQPKLGIMLDYLNEIDYTELERNGEISELAQEYIDAGVLKPKSHDDCLHLAFATVYDCDIITSWNFKHIVNLKTMRMVNAVNYSKGYRAIQILPPSMLLVGDD